MIGWAVKKQILVRDPFVNVQLLTIERKEKKIRFLTSTFPNS